MTVLSCLTTMTVSIWYRETARSGCREAEFHSIINNDLKHREVIILPASSDDMECRFEAAFPI